MTQRLLAVDWGHKYLGLAYASAEENKFSIIPLKEIKTTSWQVAVAGIVSKSSELKITKLILGDPRNEKGEKTPISLEVERFKGFLERRLKIPVILENEYYSTRESSGSHSGAAAIILHGYLEKQNETSKPKTT